MAARVVADGVLKHVQLLHCEALGELEPLQRPTPLQRPSSDIGLERYLKPRGRTGNLSPQWRSSDGGDAGAGLSSASAQREVVALMERMQRRQGKRPRR